METHAKPYTVWLPASLYLVAFLLTALARPAAAQTYESVGIRAQGMGGAFVAVADDASASWWNPAGLAHGAYFSALLEIDTGRQPQAERDANGNPAAASRSGVRGFALSYPALALSFYRLTVSQMQPIGSTVTIAAGRQDIGTGDVRLSRLTVNQFGVTVGQSVGERLVLGSTVKLIRGSLGTETTSAAAASLDAADGLGGAGETRVDLDVGAMAVFGRARIGITLKNVTAPAFRAGDTGNTAADVAAGTVNRVELNRRARMGVAITMAQVVVAADADLNSTPGVLGDERRVAAGVEAWSHAKRVGIRGGVNVNTTGDARASASGGFSVALRSGLFLDAQRTVGQDRTRQGWGLALRMSIF